jgi:hypothetical protein
MVPNASEPRGRKVRYRILGVAPFQAGKLSLFYGSVVIALQAIVLFSTPDSGFSAEDWILPMLVGLAGIYVWGVVGAWLFSAIACRVGGLEVELEEAENA